MTVAEPSGGSSWFQRFLLPGFALKAVIIGGGYATGRELAEYFVPAGPWGGLTAMLLATVIWSVVAALTFALARERANQIRAAMRMRPTLVTERLDGAPVQQVP